MKLLDQDIPMPKCSPKTWEELRASCVRCVGSVSRQLVDGEHGGPPWLYDLSERVCAGALLTSHWLTVRSDLMHGRGILIPEDIARRHGLDLALMQKAIELDTERGEDGRARDAHCNCAVIPNTAMKVVLPPYREVMHGLVVRTSKLLNGWQDARDLISDEQASEMRSLAAEARATLSLIKRSRYDTLTRRPEMGAISRGMMAIRCRLA